MLRGGGNNQANDKRLKILEPLGAGGFGKVYEALDTRSGQRVAVKELDDTNADSIARFKHEFRAFTDLHHPNLVGLKELIEQNGRWLILMELVPGMDFLRYVEAAANDNFARAAGLRYDDARLRGALIGIVEGLRALHQFGLVHRDLKPSNVRVRPDGRAVLLDFGLATSSDPKQQSTHALGVGTVAYMAPEQANRESIGPPADLYALGVCLFEALTGRAPFEGEPAIKILLDKQRHCAPRASTLAPGVPKDLDELCARLLAIDPSARPTAEEVLAILTESELSGLMALPRTASGENLFAGREAELAHLERALAHTHESELRLVLIEGESGVGKSELVAEFLRRTLERHPTLVTLRGRCYENEQVSYKAFDGCIDELTKLLRRMAEGECAALLPPRAALLGQLFPALRNVKAIAKSPREGTSADPTARRMEAFSALAQLLSKLAEERPVVLVLDDLQWSDAESFRLLYALNQHVPTPPILLLATIRPRTELDPDVRERVEELRKWQHTDVVSLFGLPREQAKALARRLLPHSTPEAWLDMIAGESEGHPLFMSELVQYTQSHDFASRGHLTLEAALRSRIDRLDRRSRELLELVAIAARPQPRALFGNALGYNIDETARELLASKLLRQRRGHELGCFHDRIRHAAADLIAKTRLPALHHQLAAALEEAPEADASEQAHHWDLAGQEERALIAYEGAARRALETLAFSRAALLCERAIALGTAHQDGRLERLTILRADALACAGRSGEAAVLYQRAAETARGDARIMLRSKAAAQLILSAKIGPGISATRKLVKELGFSMPENSAVALLRYAWEALRLFLRGREEGRTPRNVSPREQHALNVVRDMLYIVAIVHPLAFVLLSIQHLRRGVGLGGAGDTALRLATRAWFRAMNGSIATVKPLLERAQKLSEGESEPRGIAMHAYMAGSALTAALDWVGAASYLELAHRVAQEQCADSPWLLTSIRYHLGANLFQRGKHASLAEQSARWIDEARERNDVLSVCLLVGTGYGFARHLMNDNPETAILELEQAVAPIDRNFYAFPHFGQLLGMVYSLLYRGGPAALSQIEEHEQSHKDAALLRSRMCREALRLCRVLAALSAYADAPEDERASLLKLAERLTRKLERGRTKLSVSAGALSRAQLEVLAGNKEPALIAARRALVELKSLHHQGARAASYLIGLLEGGTGGHEKCRNVLRELREEGWREPARALSMHLPIHKLLDRLLRGADEAEVSKATLVLDRYEVTGQLGSGGFGAVVAARDVHSGHMLALKELVHTSGVSVERFKQEFRGLSELHHENIVQLEALFEHEGHWYIAMELVEGQHLIDYVRPEGKPDRERMCAAFAGVARGLSALHQTGFVHRDVKPENVVVTSEGRAVLIDFGLSARADARVQESAVGSLQYAAPEQLRGGVTSPAADVYALGACLYHALYGNPHVLEHYAAPLVRAAQKPPLPPAGFDDLAALCSTLLQESPEARPPLTEVLRRLTGNDEYGAASVPSLSPRMPGEELPQEADFAGREAELARLERAFARCRQTGLSIVLVQGESGLGKSALIKQFTKRAKAQLSALDLLKSRCYQNERVAFKAFDGAIDQLAQLLRGLPASECEVLLPRRAALLVQLFPVLGSVRAIAESTRKGLPADPTAQKQMGRECLVQLLVNLAERGPLVIVIDDLQWADDDSFHLIQALLQRSAELPLLLLASLRPAAEIEPAVADELERLAVHERAELISLDMLSEETALTLARRMLGDTCDPARLRELVAESKGHPLFLRELVEHQKNGLGTHPAAWTLDAALSARIARLSPEAKNLLALVAVASKPYGVSVYARALGRAELPREALLLLLQHKFLQRRGDKLACSHDRIRSVVLNALESEARASIAGKLARVLSSDVRADPAERARLWDEAGERAAAIEAYELAGNRALEALAFAQAGEHFARALSLLPGGLHDAQWRRLTVAQGQAHVCAGRSADAALCFQHAAEYASGEEAVRLRLWTAQHLLQSAQVESGLHAARKLLSELRLSLPDSDRSAKATIAWERARVKVRGIELKPRKSSAQSRLALDALRGLSSPVRAISLLPGSALVVQYLRRALDAGDPVHAARALAYEAFWRVINAPAKSQDTLFERSQDLAETTGDPALIAEVNLMRGFACVTQYRAKSAPHYLWRAHELLQSHCPGERWLLTASRMYLGFAWSQSGNFREIRQHTGAWVEDALAREDRYAVAAITGFGAASIRHVMDDDPDRALGELELAMAPWPHHPFATNHFGAFQSTTQVLASYGHGLGMLRYLEARRPELDATFFMRTPNSRAVMLAAHLQALLQAVESRHAPETKALTARARTQLRELQRMPGVTAAASGIAIEASLCVIEGDRDAAVRHLERAEALVEGIEHRVKIGIHYMLGRVSGGDKGQVLCAGVHAQLEAERFTNVPRAIAMLTPMNLALLED